MHAAWTPRNVTMAPCSGDRRGNHMKPLKLLFAAALALCAALVSAAESDPPAVVGRLSYLSGPVSFAPAEANEDWVAATVNRPVTTGDRLWTDTNGRAEMHVG